MSAQCNFFTRRIKSEGPILLTALSFLLSVGYFLQPLAISLDYSLSFLHTSGLGKILIMIAGIYQLGLFVVVQDHSFLNKLTSLAAWPFKAQSRKNFLNFFGIFSTFYLILTGIYLLSGAAYISITPGMFTAKKLLFTYPLQLTIGLIATLALVWFEEIIFRGCLKVHFHRHYNIYLTTFICSFIFMLLHDLKNPLNLLTIHWQLGLGLFLLGVLFSAILVTYHDMGASAGAHAGLVFTKVFFRKIKIVSHSPDQYWFPSDLRESLWIHVLMITAIMVLAVYSRKHHKKSIIKID